MRRSAQCRGKKIALTRRKNIQYISNSIISPQYWLHMGTSTPGKSRDKFVELAEKRVSRAIKDMRLIGNLSNRSNYSYTEDDVRKIIKALKDEVDALKARFDATGSDARPVFKL